MSIYPFEWLDLALAILYSMEFAGRKGELSCTLFRVSNW